MLLVVVVALDAFVVGFLSYLVVAVLMALEYNGPCNAVSNE